MTSTVSNLDITLASLEPFIRSQAMRLCGPYSRFGWDWEDLAQAGRLAVANGLANDPAMDRSLLMRRAVCDMVDEMRRIGHSRRKRDQVELLSMDAPFNDTQCFADYLPHNGPSPAEICAAQDSRAWLLAQADKLLSPIVAQWIKALADGTSQAELSRAYGCTKANVNIRLNKAMRILRRTYRPEPPRVSPRSPRVKAQCGPDMARPG